MRHCGVLVGCIYGGSDEKLAVRCVLFFFFWSKLGVSLGMVDLPWCGGHSLFFCGCLVLVLCVHRIITVKNHDYDNRK